jgi:hypothetical protein
MHSHTLKTRSKYSSSKSKTSFSTQLHVGHRPSLSRIHQPIDSLIIRWMGNSFGIRQGGGMDFRQGGRRPFLKCNIRRSPAITNTNRLWQQKASGFTTGPLCWYWWGASTKHVVCTLWPHRKRICKIQTLRRRTATFSSWLGSSCCNCGVISNLMKNISLG